MKKIPLHSLVIAVGEASVAKTDLLCPKHFSPYEIVGAAKIAHELVGDDDRADILTQVGNEIHRRATLKLSLGERVIVDAENLRREDRVALAHIGIRAGVPVFYLVADEAHGDQFIGAERDIVRGDGIAEVIDGRVTKFEVTQKLPDDHVLEEIKARGYVGITVVGDVHGMYEAMQNALTWARYRRHFLLFLGDIIDYGRKTLEVGDEVYRLVMRGEAEFVIGNHERKIARWLDQIDDGKVTLNLSEGNRVTTQALAALNGNERRRWVSRFRALLAQSRQHRRIGNMLFVHGAAHEDLWTMTDRRLPKAIEGIALFGETTGPKRADGGYPVRTHNWVAQIPASHTVIVGHEIRSKIKPTTETNAEGGTAVFLDTGSGKGGQLTSADLAITDEGALKLLHYNQH